MRTASQRRRGPTVAEHIRTDFIDYPTGFRIQEETPDLSHHERCSAPVFLCDCGAMPREWARRAKEQEPDRADAIDAELRRYLPSEGDDRG